MRWWFDLGFPLLMKTLHGVGLVLMGLFRVVGRVVGRVGGVGGLWVGQGQCVS